MFSFRLSIRVCLALLAASSPPVHAQQQSSSNPSPLVYVLATGGTISGSGATSTSLTEYNAGSVLGEDLVKAVPEIQRYANVKLEQQGTC